MKSIRNGLKTGILTLGLAGLLGGCGDRVKSSMGPDYKAPVASEEVASESVLGYFRDTGDLSGSLAMTSGVIGKNNVSVLEDIANGEGPAAKAVASHSIDDKGYMVVPADSNPDFVGDEVDVGDHKVDFYDFFDFVDHFGISEGDDDWDSRHDLVPNKKVDFDDFFKFVDYFGENVNSGPVFVDGINPGGDLVVPFGVDIDLGVKYSDWERDEINHRWEQNGNLIEVNGGNLIWCPKEPGEYNVSVSAYDENGVEGDEVKFKRVVVESPAPELNLPESISFDQLEHSYSLDLGNYVVSDNGVDFSVNFLGSNKFEHNKENAYPMGTRLRDPYTAEKLRHELDGDELTVFSVSNYNESDHGKGEMVVTAIDEINGTSVKDTVDVYVDRVPELDRDYDDFAFEKGPKVPYREYYIWTGNAEDGGGEWLGEGNFTGSSTTDEQIANFERLAMVLPEDIGGFFDVPYEIKEINNYEDYLALYNRKDADNPAVFFYATEYEDSGATYVKRDSDRDYYLVEIGVHPGEKFDTYIHELLCHGLGFAHPIDEKESDGERTIFAGGNDLYLPSDWDRKIIEYRYEVK